VERTELARRIEEVQTEYGKIRVKLGTRGDSVLNAHPEFEDCKRAAQEKGVPLKQVFSAALAALGPLLQSRAWVHPPAAARAGGEEPWSTS
jgi:pyridinium-3,5-bisthiocarboxylic acid mononucleotide nickel chelatase